jgi:hypothetical protein
VKKKADRAEAAAKTNVAEKALADLKSDLMSALQPPQKLRSKKPKPVTPPPADTAQPAAHHMGEIERFADFCKQNHAATIASVVLEHEVDDLKTQIATIEVWLSNFDLMLEERKKAMSPSMN